MGNVSPNAYAKKARKNVDFVWFEGSTALNEGDGVCYNFDYGTASSSDERRYTRVEMPSDSNNNHFAGVAARAYAAKTGGQWIEIYRPGSVCNVYATENTTLGDRIICVYTDGGWDADDGSTVGEGTAYALQTVTAPTQCLAILLTGQPSGLQAD